MNLREKILTASFHAGACHIGSALSCAELVEAIYEVKRPEDVFLFAKASGVAALYCHLFPLKKATEYLKKYPLPNRKVPGVIWSGGSCGQGLSVAVGIALSKKLRGEKGMVYCLISDGELQEGQTHEAAMFAGHHKLNNLVVIVDNNKFQGLGRTEDIIDLGLSSYHFMDAPFYGWRMSQCDGHNREVVAGGLPVPFPDCPKLLIADTIKGKGVDFMENDKMGYHYANLDETRYKEALLQVADKEGSEK